MLLTRAVEIAKYAHAGQVDKAGADYIQHPLRVMDAVDSEEAKIVAVLHDVVEDSEISLQDLRDRGFNEAILEAISCLTKKEGENYEQFIRRVSSNELARLVKIADLRDNMNVDRLPKVTEQDLARVTKYQKALVTLLAHE